MEVKMPRPRMRRLIANEPKSRFYKPKGVKMRNIKMLILSHDQLEALRLADQNKMDQESAAQLMNISRSTFSRLVGEARNITATALNNGWALKIEGGDFEVSKTNPKNKKGGE
jgi:predicted DNA-binding protein (UPF0251 family)